MLGWETYSTKVRFCPTKVPGPPAKVCSPTKRVRAGSEICGGLENVEAGGYFVLVAFADRDLIAK